MEIKIGICKGKTSGDICKHGSAQGGHYNASYMHPKHSCEDEDRSCTGWEKIKVVTVEV
jgi:hypothetical protein